MTDYNIKLKLPWKVTRTSTEVLFTCLNVVQQLKPDFICNFYLKVKKISYFSVFFVSLRYFANQQTSIALACLSGGSREQEIVSLSIFRRSENELLF